MQGAQHNLKQALVQQRIEKRYEQIAKSATMNVEMDRPFEDKEVYKIVRNMKRGKATGTDDITSDWVMDLDIENRRSLVELLKEAPDNYRPLSLLSTLFKLVAAMMNNRLEDEFEAQLGEA